MRYLTFHNSLLMGVLTALVGVTGAISQPIPVDGFAAVVNDQIITVGEVHVYVAPVEQQLRLSYKGEELREELKNAYQKALENLVERALILEELKEKQAQVPEAVVEDHIRDMLKERFNDNRSELLKALASERLSLDEWKDQIRERLAITMARQMEISSKIQISPTQVRENYNRLKEEVFTEEAKTQLSMIVLHQGSTDDEKAAKREEAERVRQRILDGEAFNTVARAVSEGSRASRGGDWDWMNPSDLRKELQTAVKELDPGEVSPVIEAGDEFYLLKVEGRKNAQVTPFDDVRQDIERRLRAEEEERLYKAWIARLRDTYYVKIY